MIFAQAWTRVINIRFGFGSWLSRSGPSSAELSLVALRSSPRGCGGAKVFNVRSACSARPAAEFFSVDVIALPGPMSPIWPHMHAIAVCRRPETVPGGITRTYATRRRCAVLVMKALGGIDKLLLKLLFFSHKAHLFIRTGFRSPPAAMFHDLMLLKMQVLHGQHTEMLFHSHWAGADIVPINGLPSAQNYSTLPAPSLCCLCTDIPCGAPFDCAQKGATSLRMADGWSRGLTVVLAAPSLTASHALLHSLSIIGV